MLQQVRNPIRSHKYNEIKRLSRNDTGDIVVGNIHSLLIHVLDDLWELELEGVAILRNSSTIRSPSARKITVILRDLPRSGARHGSPSQRLSTFDNLKPPVVHALDVPWVFRGFVEPMMDNGHEVGWRH